MSRYISPLLIAACAPFVHGQGGIPAFAPPLPPVITASPPVVAAPPPPAAAYTPGDGMTVSLLNGTSKVKLFAQFSALGVVSTTRPFPVGGPLFLLPRAENGNRTNTFDLSARQTAFGAAFSGPDLFGFTPGATFLGFIQNDSLTADAYGFLPFNAYGELKNDVWRFTAGLQSDVFNPLNPTINSLLKLYTSGNTGSFRGQARAEYYFKPDDAFQVTTQVALGKPVASVVTDNRRLLEDNGWPNVELRTAVGVGAVREVAGGRKLRPVEVGVSGVVGQLRNSKLFASPEDPEPTVRSVIDVWGLGADVQAAVTDRLGFSGEVFIGSGLGEYNGGIGQTFNSGNLQPIRTAGGFGEGYFYVTDQLHLHAGYGIDAPLRRDLAATQIARNETYYANLIWDASKNLQLSFEVEYRKTDFVTFRDADGVVFVTQFLWKF